MFWLVAIVLSATSLLKAQNTLTLQPIYDQDRQVYSIELQQPEGEFWAIHLIRAGELPLGEITYRLVSERDGTEQWQTLSIDPHSPRLDVSSQIFVADDYTLVEFKFVEGSYTIEAFDPGLSSEEFELKPLGRSEDCIQPLALNRSEWCPTGTCPTAASPVVTNVTHLPVHHSAGTNTASDWAAVVRSIWNFHVNTNGWADIGYNYLIDPNGVIYVGRGEDIRGAHFCGNNTGTMGICILGNFTSQTPTLEAIEGLVNLLAWKMSVDDIDPQLSSFHTASGVVLPHIVRHRDGCATSCPGNSFAPLFDNIRQQVADSIASCMVSGTSAGGDLSAELNVFPNPAREWIAIQGRILDDIPGNRLDWVLVDLFGRPVSSGNWSIGAGRVDQRIELGRLPAEVYILKIISGEKSRSYWVMKK